MKNLKCLFLDWHNTLSTSLFWEHLGDPSRACHHFLASITSALFRNPAELFDDILCSAPESVSFLFVRKAYIQSG